MHKYINNNKISLAEKFPIVGWVIMQPGEIRELPQGIANVWMNKKRQSVVIELYKEEDKVAIPEILPVAYDELLKLAKLLKLDLGKSPKKAEVISAIESKRGV